MGNDGHTASLFPHQTNFDDPNVAVIAKHPETGQIRISKTAKLIEQAKRITYLVTGESKADILKRNPNDSCRKSALSCCQNSGEKRRDGMVFG